MQRVTVLAELKAKPGMEERVRGELLDMVEKTRKENGCLNYDLHVSEDDPSTFVFYENWVSQMALQDHFETAHLKRLRELASEILTQPAQIKILRMVSDPE